MSTDEVDLQPGGVVAGPRPTPPGRRVAIVVAVIVAGILVLNLLAFGLDRAVGGSQPGGANGSSYATAPAGLAAFSTLVAQYGHTVVRFNQPIADATLPPNATVFVLEPSSLTAADSDALLEFVDEGGRLVVGGAAPFYLRNFSDDPPTWSPEGSTSWTEIDPSYAGVTTIDAAGTGSWSTTGAGHALVDTGGGAALLTEQAVGQGQILFLADASPLENEFLPRPTTPRSRWRWPATRADRSCSRKACTGTARAGASPRSPMRWKIALALVGAGGVGVRVVARPPLRPARSRRPRPPARARRVRAGAVGQSRTHARTRPPRSEPRNGGPARGSPRSPGSRPLPTTTRSRTPHTRWVALTTRSRHCSRRSRTTRVCSPSDE